MKGKGSQIEQILAGRYATHEHDRMRRRQFIIAALLTLGVGLVLCSLSGPIFRRWPSTVGSIFAIPVYGGVIWLIGGLIYSLLKRQPAFIGGIVVGLLLELAVAFVLTFYVFPPRF